MGEADQRATGGLNVDALLRLMRRQLIMILLCLLIPTVAAYALSDRRSKTYTATASLLFSPDTVSSELFGFGLRSASDPAREMATNVALVTTGPTAQKTAAALDLSTADVSDRIIVEQAGQTDIVNVSAVDDEPADAARLATTYAETFVEGERQRVRTATLDARDRILAKLESSNSLDDRQTRSALRQRSDQLLSLASVRNGDVSLLEPAVTPTVPSGPRSKRAAMLGGAFGLLLATGWLLLRYRFGRRLDDVEEAAAASGYRLLVELPRSKSSVAPENFGELPPDQADATRMLRAQLRYFNGDRDIRTVLIAAGSTKRGISTVARNLALAAAEGSSQERVLLIEADFRDPQLAARAGIQPYPGLSELLSDQTTLEQAVQAVEGPAVVGPGGAARSQLAVITAGSVVVNPVNLVGSQRMRELLEQLAVQFKFIVIDATPLAMLPDALPLAAMVDGVVVVTRVAHSTRREVEDLHKLLDAAGANVVGAVVNDVPSTSAYAAAT